MSELSGGARVALLAGSAAVLFAAIATAGSWDDPYAPNDWLFSHVVLAQQALADERIPLNRGLLTQNGFAETTDEFQAETGLARMTFYANTMWHFWNGLPLHPSLVATLAALTGVEPETVARVPLGGLAVLLLAYAAADRVVAHARGEGRLAHAAPFLVATASAPLLLDLRVLMPSTSLVVLALLFLLLARRLLARDEHALPVAVATLALLPFWYYTVSYFVILLFLGFLLGTLALRLRGSDTPPIVPLAVAAAVPAALTGILLLNGALTSHVQMATHLGGAGLFGGEASADYASRLNRQPWRSALLYVGLALLFVPLALVSLRAAWRLARREAVEPAPAVFAQWAVGGGLFTLLMQGAVGSSFLNRSVIYLTPLAVVALLWLAARAWSRRSARVAFAAALVAWLVTTPLLVATAAPTYTQADRAAFAWMEAEVPRDAVVYGSLDASSVLFRDHGFHEVIAFHPRTRLLEDFWYGEDPAAMQVYLASCDWFVLRDDARTTGFEEFGPLRQPVSEAAYGKFARSRDLQLVFDNGAVQVFRVALAPSGLG